MTVRVLLSAALTGVFCVGFSLLVGWLSMALSMQVLVGLSFVSGFGGSLFARLILRGDD
jgi:nucleoside permease NupC